MYYGKAEAGVSIACQNLTRQDVEEEPTGTYLRRVLAGNTHPSAPTANSFEPTIGPYDRVSQLDEVTWVTSYPPYDMFWARAKLTRAAN